MDYEFSIERRAGTPAETHKTIIRWMKDNVGVRGTDWSIKKPREWTCTVRVKSKDHAALVKMAFSDCLVYKP